MFRSKPDDRFFSVPADATRLVPVSSDRGMSEPRILVASKDRGATLVSSTQIKKYNSSYLLVGLVPTS
jgi:hypothetical protein